MEPSVFQIILEKKSDIPLYIQLRDAILASVENGRLRTGDRLPPVTALAGELGVTQSTIRRAFEDLTKSGVIESHVGRGTFIARKTEQADKMDRPGASAFPKSRHPSDPEGTDAARRLRTGIGKSLDALMPLTKRPGLIRFSCGLPDPSLVEAGVLQDLTIKALEKEPSRYREYTDPLGMPELREALSRRFSERGFAVGPDQLMIVSGSQQGISLMAHLALEKGLQPVCEVPCYTGVCDAFSILGHWVESVVRDAEGPLLERLERGRADKPPMLYVCNLLHNPMGEDLSKQRRRRILEWLERRQGMLVADEVFQDLHFDYPEVPSLLSEIGCGRVAVTGSFSKSFMCGLRVGWLAADAEMINKLAHIRHAGDLGGPGLMQGIALELLTSGHYETHIRRGLAHYRQRRDLVIRALEANMPESVTWTRPKGGFHLWVELPHGYSSIALFLSAVERGVAIVPGPYLDVEHRFVNAFRLSYGHLSEDQIEKGVALLAEAVRSLLRHPPEVHRQGGVGDYL